MRLELFIGITTWNDEYFLPFCLKSLNETLDGVEYTICIADNGSTDGTLDIARQHANHIRVRCESQPNALNYLVSQSKAKYTLLIHSDVVMLSSDWYRVCREHLKSGNILVSPEDIGLGNYQRTFGTGKPESSFMLFDTTWLKQKRGLILKNILWKVSGQSKRAVYGIDFYGAHVTHNLPEVIRKSYCEWMPMKVYPSNRNSEPIHVDKDSTWLADPAYRTYGYGNFYSLNGIVTHYHNWFSRWESKFGKEQSKWGVQASMIESYTMRFLTDYMDDCVEFPQDVD